MLTLRARRTAVAHRLAPAVLGMMLIAVPSPGQQLSFGAIGGVELTSDFRYRAPGTSYFVLDNVRTDVQFAFARTRFAPKFGLRVEYELTPRWSLEADILVHRSAFTATSSFNAPVSLFPGGPLFSRQVRRYEETVWEAPVLARRRFVLGHRQLILEGGPSFRPFGGIDGPGRFGIAGGIGTMWRTGRVRLEPSLRYTRWTDVRQPFSPAPFRRDEIAFLLAADADSATLRGASGRQPLSLGFIGGTTLTKSFPRKGSSEGLTSRLAGIALDYRFSNRWSAEADVLYHPLVLSEEARATVLTWEIPLMAKFRFGSGASRPLVTAGPTFRPSGNRNSTNPSSLGFTSGLGWEIAAGRFQFEPTLRYVRWRVDSPAENAPASSRPDQLQAMLSIRFGGK